MEQREFVKGLQKGGSCGEREKGLTQKRRSHNRGTAERRMPLRPPADNSRLPCRGFNPTCRRRWCRRCYRPSGAWGSACLGQGGKRHGVAQVGCSAQAGAWYTASSTDGGRKASTQGSTPGSGVLPPT